MSENRFSTPTPSPGPGRGWSCWVATGFCLLLCSCNAVPARQAVDQALAAPAQGGFPQQVCEDTHCVVGPVVDETCQPATVDGPPLPVTSCGPWKPPGLPCPWPPNEFICDGGDREMAVNVDREWQIYGLDTQDTIAHYDTLAGQRVVKPSNRVCIYAPRFGSVRKIVHPLLNEQIDAPGGVRQPVALVRYDERQEATTTLQHTPLQINLARKGPGVIKSRARLDVISENVFAEALQDSLLPYENVAVIRTGKYEQSDKAYLAKNVAAAVLWTDVQAVQVTIDHQAANEVVGDQKAEAVFTVKGGGCPMLRVIKVASTPSANPGDTVDFTIRFDNVGTETIGNVTIVDNLTPRLEYVPGTAQASVKGDFSTEPNSSGSLILRWEVTNPLEPEQGGIVRFQCVVR